MLCSALLQVASLFTFLSSLAYSSLLSSRFCWFQFGAFRFAGKRWTVFAPWKAWGALGRDVFVWDAEEGAAGRCSEATVACAPGWLAASSL